MSEVQPGAGGTTAVHDDSIKWLHVQGYRGTSLTRNTPPHQVHHVALDIVLLLWVG